MGNSQSDLLTRFVKYCEAKAVPDLQAFIEENGPVSVDDLSALACRDMHQRWLVGQAIDTKWYVDRFPILATTADGLADLLFTECLERKQREREFDAEPLLSQFALVSETVRSQLSFHQTLSDARFPVVCDPADDSRTTLDFGADSTAAQGKPAEARLNIDGYQILDEVGRGGMGVVYRAIDLNLRRVVAIKMLLGGAYASAANLRRIHAEARAAARLKHPDIVQIHEIGEHQGLPYLVLEYVEGGSLASSIEGRPMPPRSAATLIHRIARAIDYAHHCGIVHRDLKPANILLSAQRDGAEFPLPRGHAPSDATRPDAGGETRSVRLPSADELHTKSGKSQPSSEICANRDGDARASKGLGPSADPDAAALSELAPKITDFGLAKVAVDTEPESVAMTCTGDIFGTPGYMAPEQAVGRTRDIGVASDVYSIGAILYELLTGRPPFVGSSPLDTLRQVAGSEPIHPSRLVRPMPADIQTICLKCLEKDPDRRYPSAAALADDLERFLTDRPILARPISQFGRLRRWGKRNPEIAVLVSTVAVLLVLVSMISSVGVIRLNYQLKKTELAESQAVERLFESFLFQAEAHRTSGRIGQRMEGLDALRQAVELADQVPLSAERIATIRNTAVACLVLPDLALTDKWSAPGHAKIQDADASLARYVTRSDSGIIEVCQSGSGELIAALDERADGAELDSSETVYSLSSDGNWLVANSRRILVWRIEEGQATRTIDMPSGGRFWKIAPDNRFMVGTSAEGKLLKVNLAAGEPAVELGTHRATGTLAISADSRWAAVPVGNELRIIDLIDGAVNRILDAPQADSHETNIVWSADGRRIAAGPYRDKLQVWDVQSGRVLHTFNSSLNFASLRFDPSGKFLIAYSAWTGELTVWRVGASKPWFKATGHFIIPSHSTSGGTMLLMKRGDAETLESWQLVVGQAYQNSTAGSSDLGQPYSVHFGPQASRLIVCGLLSIGVFDATDLAPIGNFPAGFHNAVSDAKHHLWSVAQGDVYRWPLELVGATTGPISIEAGPPQRMLSGIYGDNVTVSDDGQVAAISDGEGIVVWRAGDAQPARFGPHEDVRSIAISPDRQWIATGAWWSGMVKIWSFPDGELIRTLTTGPHAILEFSPDSRFLATSADGGIVWRTSDWDSAYRLNSLDSETSGMRIRFTPDGSALAYSTSDGRIRFVDSATGRPLLDLQDPHHDRFGDFAFSRDGRRLAACAWDAESKSAWIMAWDMTEIGRELNELRLAWPEELSNRYFADVFSGPPVPASASTDGVPPSEMAGVAKQLIINRDQNVDRIESDALVRFVLRQWADQETSIEFLRRAVALAPDNAAACNNLAWLLSIGPEPLRNPVEALELARRAVASTPGEATYLNTLATALYRAGDVEEAVAKFQESLTHSTPEAQAFDLFFLAMCHARLGKLDEANAWLKQAHQSWQQHRAQQPAAWQGELRSIAREAETLLQGPLGQD